MYVELPHEIIAQRAHLKWEQRGCPQGSADVDWFAARAELERERIEEEANERFAEQCQQVAATVAHMNVAGLANVRRTRRASAPITPPQRRPGAQAAHG